MVSMLAVQLRGLEFNLLLRQVPNQAILIFHLKFGLLVFFSIRDYSQS